MFQCPKCRKEGSPSFLPTSLSLRKNRWSLHLSFQLLTPFQARPHLAASMEVTITGAPLRPLAK